MNYHFSKRLYDQHCSVDDGLHSAERVLIGLLLIGPDKIENVRSKVCPDDMQLAVNSSILASIYGLANEGQTPTRQLICEALGPVKIDHKLTLDDYISGCLSEAMPEMLLPIQGVVETIVRRAQLRGLDDVSRALSMARDGSKSVPEICREATDGIENVLTLFGKGNRPGMDAKDVGEAAMRGFRGEGQRGPATGFHDIDNRIGCWPLAQLSIVAARPGMGKSCFMTSAALQVAKKDASVLIFSLEMTHEQLGQRMLTDLAFTSTDPICYQNAGRGPLTTREESLLNHAQRKLDELSIHVHDRPGLTVDDISVLSKRYAAELRNRGRSLDVIFVDHIGIMTVADHHNGRRDREIADITIGLARLAKILNIPVIALCQLNRGVEGRDNKRPTLADLRDSGAIEEDASLVLMLYRQAYYLERARFDDEEAERVRLETLDRVRNKLEVGIEKNRNGATGRVDLFVHVGANAVRDGKF